MIIVNVIGNQIVGSLNGEQFGVSFDEQKYETMLELRDKADAAQTVEELLAVVEEFRPLTMESYKELVETMSPYVYVNRHTNKFYLKYNKEISSKALPQIIADKIILSVEKRIDMTPLVKCWVRLLRNPKYTDNKAKLFAEYISAPFVNKAYATKQMKEFGVSEKVATERATTTQVAISKEGLLVCYKVSREILNKYKLNEDEEVIERSRYGKEIDEVTGLVTYKKPQFVEDRIFEPACMGQGGDAFLCDGVKGHIIKVGSLHALESWDQVDTNDNHSGCPGLHVGGLRYIEGFQNSQGAVTHNVLVDPMHIGAIVGLGSGNDGAMRVLKYFVHSSFDGPNRSVYHSSTYAAMTDSEYAKMVEEAVKATAMKKDELQRQLDEQKAIATA